MHAVWYERQGAADEVLVCGELPTPEVRRPMPHPKAGTQSGTVAAKNQCIATGAALGHNQVRALDVERRGLRQPGVGIVHRRRARLRNKRPQLGEVLTPSLDLTDIAAPSAWQEEVG